MNPRLSVPPRKPHTPAMLLRGSVPNGGAAFRRMTVELPLAVLDDEYRILSANRAFLECFRLSPDATGHSVFDLCGREAHRLRQMLSGSLPADCIIENVEPDSENRRSSPRTLRFRAQPLLGEVPMILLTVEDIVEPEHRQIQNGQAHIIRQLQQADEELTTFARIIAHDLKAPLRAIATLADWIIADQTDRLDADGRQHLTLLTRRIRRLDAFIDGLVEWARTAHSRETAAPAAPVDLNRLVQDVVESLMPPPHIAVLIEGRLPTIAADWPRIQQVFQNLLANAIRFMDKPQGKIVVTSESEGAFWKFGVSDNGPGIDPRHFHRIFEMFRTLQPRDRVESTGVGLAIVKRIVEAGGGRVWVQSTPGSGSTFFFTLPKSGSEGSKPES